MPFHTDKPTFHNMNELPHHVRDAFQRLIKFRYSVSLPFANSSTDKSTMSLLRINGRDFFGSNSGTMGITMSKARRVQGTLQQAHGKSAHCTVLLHAETDALVQAYEKGIKANTANMYVDRKLCGFCGGRSFNGGSLRRVLPLVGLNALTVWTPDDSGRILPVTVFPAR